MAITAVTKEFYYDRTPVSGEEEITVMSKGDTYVSSGNNDNCYGTDASFKVGREAVGAGIMRGYIELKLPPLPNNAGRIKSLKLKLYVEDYDTAGSIFVGLRINTLKLRPGETSSGVPDSGLIGMSWDLMDGFTIWNDDEKKGAQALDKLSVSASDIGTYIEWDITDLVLYKNITWGGSVDLGIKAQGDDILTNWVTFSSMESATAAQRPKIEITYEVEDGATPENEEAFLTVEPNPADPTQVKLMWKRPKNKALKKDDGTNNGAYVLIRSKTSIQDMGDGVIVGRISSDLEFIDTELESGTATSTTSNHLIDSTAKFQTKGVVVGAWVHNTTDDTWARVTVVGSETDLTLDTDIMISGEAYEIPIADGQTYYYRILICDENNYAEGTGLGSWASTDVTGAPLWSNEVVIEKPKVTAFIEIGSDYAWDVWEEHTVRTTCPAPSLAGVLNEAYQYDWQGDESETGWVELETPSNVHEQKYSYTSYGSGSVTPYVRVRNSLGFWSGRSPSSQAAIGLTALVALAEIRVSPKQVPVGEGFRLRADESQDQNADGTITKFEFQIRRASDNWYWNKTLGGSGDWQVGSYWNDEGTTEYYDLIAAGVDVATLYSCKSRVTGLSAFAVESSVDTVTSILETPVDIRTGLSSDVLLTLSNVMREAITTKRVKLEGTESIRIFEGIGSEDRTIEGITRGEANSLDDILQLHTWQEDQILLKYFYDEPANVKYITFRITTLRGRRRERYRYVWAIGIDVESKT